MRLSEIEPGQKRNIGPEIIGYNVQKFDQMWDKLIAPNCSQALNSCKTAGRFMYRGFNSNQPIVRGRSWNNRIPVDSDDDLSKHFDDMLKALGFKALRSNSIFVTSVFRTAKYFGTPYIVLPTNGFDYTYTAFHDLTFTPDSRGTLGNEWMDSNDTRVFIDDFNPKNTNIEDAIARGMEICIHGQYYALKYNMYGEYLSKKLGIGLPE